MQVRPTGSQGFANGDGWPVTTRDRPETSAAARGRLADAWILTRRALLAGGAAVATGALAGCSAFGTLRNGIDALGRLAEGAGDLLGNVPDASVANLDEAISFMTSRLAERFGESFSQDPNAQPETGTNDDYGIYARQTYYRVGFVPDSAPDRPFTAFLRTKPDSTKLASDVECDWPVYLFLDRALQPFRDALAGAQGLAGWGVKLDYVRYDARVWKADEFDEYMGKGAAGSSDPEVIVYLMLPKGESQENWAAAIHAAEGPVYALNRHTQVLAMEEGQSVKNVVYITDQTYVGADREGVPTEEDAQRQVRNWSFMHDDDAWDGTTNGGDPGLSSYRPQITWAPGHGPSSW